MNIDVDTRRRVLGLSVVVTCIAFIALMAGAFAGWLHFGSNIVLDLASSGLSWCF